MEEIKIVIGSWGSYNECNERALGSKWLDLSDYSDWEEIEEELKKEGFILDGIDEELFIQDYEGLPDGINGDYTHPKTLFETLNDKARTHLLSSGLPDINYIQDGLKRNFINVDETGNTESLLWDTSKQFNNLEDDFHQFKDSTITELQLIKETTALDENNIK